MLMMAATVTGNKLRYSFKVLILHNRKSVMSGTVNAECEIIK